MKILFIVIGVFILAIIIFIVYRNITVNNQSKKINETRFERIKPIYQKLENGENITASEIIPFAKNILTREATFQLLAENKKTELFPKEFNTIEKGAESNLANWLEFPTELDGCPDEMELVKRVTIDFEKNNVFYYVFKFRTNEPHWASKDGWMLGVVGPYFEDSEPYDFPRATFSRLSSKFDNVKAEDEAKRVHENISMKN
jgi:cell division protein FtsI/penicillin-binding protein 2